MNNNNQNLHVIFFFLMLLFMSCSSEGLRRKVIAYQTFNPYTLTGLYPIYDSSLLLYPYISYTRLKDSLIITRVYNDSTYSSANYFKLDGIWQRKVNQIYRINSSIHEFVFDSTIVRLGLVLNKSDTVDNSFIFQLAFYKKDTVFCFLFDKPRGIAEKDNLIKLSRPELFNISKSVIRTIFSRFSDSICVQTDLLKCLDGQNYYLHDSVVSNIKKFRISNTKNYYWYVFDWHEDFEYQNTIEVPRYQILY